MTAAPRRGWSVERRVDTVGAMHGPWPDPGATQRRTVALCSVVGHRTIVLGSAQSIDVVDRERALCHDVEVVRRGSGGGAVMVGPAEQVWMDVWIPRGDPLWEDDVVASSWWLGETWARALEGLGAPPLVVHRGRAVRTDWSDVVCFAGVGPGEVSSGTAKVVGVAQRRTRQGARLHSMAPLSWEPAPLLALLSLDAAQARRFDGADDALADVATGIRSILPMSLRDAGADRVVASVEGALLSALP